MSQAVKATSRPKAAQPKVTKPYPLPKPIKPSASVSKVGVWELQSTEFAEFQPPENTETLFNGVPPESVIGGDGRKVVPKKHLAPGGKYRGTSSTLHFGIAVKVL